MRNAGSTFISNSVHNIMATAIRLTCGICRCSYKMPKILPCFHSFCETCMESHISRARPNPKFQCPLCRTDIDIPEGGARSLQTNYYIETVDEVITENKGTVLCENCDDEHRHDAIKYCKVCQQHICENCALLHKKLKITKSHELFDLDHLNETRSYQKPCSKHSAELAESYCQNCHEFLCSVCRDQCHGQHVIENIKVAAERRKTDIQKSLEESATYIYLTQTRLEVIQELKSVVKSHEMKAVEKLEKKANILKEQINSGVKELSVQITQYCEKELSKLDSIEKCMASTLEKHEAIRKWVQNASDEEMLAEGSMMQTKIMAVNASLPSYVPPLSLVTFTEKIDTKLTAEKLGSVKNQKTSSDVGNIEMELINTFCLPHSWQIMSILPYKDMQTLMVQQRRNGLSLYDEHGVKCNQILENLEIIAADCDSDLNMFVSVSKECKLYKISRDCTVTTLCTLPIIPESIAACPDGRVVVCSGKSERLLVIDQSGKNITYLKLGKGTFKLLKSIAVCKYTNILAVCDETLRLADNSKFYVKVHLIDYRGENINTLESLQVYCAMPDNRGHFLLGLNDGVTVIDTLGNTLANLVCSKHSFQTLCLTVDNVNQLWIGGKGIIYIFKCPNVSISMTNSKGFK